MRKRWQWPSVLIVFLLTCCLTAAVWAGARQSPDGDRIVRDTTCGGSVASTCLAGARLSSCISQSCSGEAQQPDNQTLNSGFWRPEAVPAFVDGWAAY